MSGAFNILITGVGGQGIGLLSETLIRAADHAGLAVRGCDTHGLAQRGGIVTSHVRIGKDAHSPLVMEASANLVIALERHEAVRAGARYLCEEGTLVWYDTSWQPLDVRLGKARETVPQDIADLCQKLRAKQVRVCEDLDDTRLQNTAVLAAVVAGELIPGVKAQHLAEALSDILSGGALKANLDLAAKGPRG